MQKNLFGIIVVMCVFITGNAAATGHRHHEATAILLEYLAEQDAGIQALRYGQDITREGVRRAASRNDPAISASLGATGTLSRIDQKTGSGQRTKNHSSNHDLNASIRLSKTLLDWGREDDAVRSAQIGVLANEENIRRETETIYLTALRAYYTVVQALARMQLREKNLETLNKKRDEAQKRLKAGLDNKTLVAIAEASFALGKSELVQEKSALESALNDLKVYAPEGFEEYIPQKVIFPAPNAQVQGISLEAALEEQKFYSPVIAQALQGIAQAKAQLDVLRHADDPDLSLSLSANRTQGYGDTTSRNTSAVAAITLNVPLLSSGSVSSDIRAQQQRISQAQMQYRATLDRQSALLKRAWNEFHALEASLEAGETNVAARRALLARANEALKVGQYTQTQVLDEEDKLLAAELQIIDAQYQRLLKAFEITNLMGWGLQEYL